MTIYFIVICDLVKCVSYFTPNFPHNAPKNSVRKGAGVGRCDCILNPEMSIVRQVVWTGKAGVQVAPSKNAFRQMKTSCLPLYYTLCYFRIVFLFVLVDNLFFFKEMLKYVSSLKPLSAKMPCFTDLTKTILFFPLKFILNPLCCLSFVELKGMVFNAG